MTRPNNDDQVRPQLKSSIIYLLHHVVALDIIPQLTSSVSNNPFLDRSLVAESKLKNVGEVVIVQGVCFGEVIKTCITVN
jgi:hypothetical protein